MGKKFIGVGVYVRRQVLPRDIGNCKKKAQLLAQFLAANHFAHVMKWSDPMRDAREAKRKRKA